MKKVEAGNARLRRAVSELMDKMILAEVGKGSYSSPAHRQADIDGPRSKLKAAKRRVRGVFGEHRSSQLRIPTPGQTRSG